MRELSDFPGAFITDGGYFESNYWQLDGGFSRYANAGNWGADLIVMRLSENVTDLSHDFSGYYKQLIDVLKTANPSAKVVLTTSVWNTLNQTQVDVSSAITQVGTERNYPVANLNSIPGGTAGYGSHPNDAAHNEIAERIWAAIPKSSAGTSTGTGTATPTPTSNSENNKPVFDTFNYDPILTNTAWPEYDGRIHRGKPIGDKAVLDNGIIRVEFWRNFGGSPGHISYSGTGVNMINQNDWGRGAWLTIYRGGRTRQDDSQNKQVHPAWATIEGGGLGNNPLQGGDVYDNEAVAMQIGISSDGTMVYIKSRMLNFAVDNDPTDVIVEQWAWLDGPRCKIKAKLTMNRTGDTTQYPARSNEYPQMIVNTNLQYNAHSDANGNIEYFIGGPQTSFPVGQNWYAMVPNPASNAQGLGMVADGLYSVTRPEHYAPGEGCTGEFCNEAIYSARELHHMWDWNGQYFTSHDFMVGTVQQIKDYALSKPDPRNRLAWKFNARNGRGYLWGENWVDTGYPTPDTGIKITVTKASDFKIKLPRVALQTSGFQKLYIRYKAGNGYPSTGKFSYKKVGQTEIEGAGNAYGYTYPMIADGQWHIAEIPFSNTGAWNGILNEVSIEADAPVGATIEIDWYNTQNQEPVL